MFFNGDVLEYVEKGEEYSASSADVTCIYNGIELTASVNSNINTYMVGSYPVDYTLGLENMQNKIIKT